MTAYAHKASAVKAARKALGADAKFNVIVNGAGKFEWAKARKNSGGPVDHVWAFLAATPDMKRSEQIKALIADGYNANMVRTQTYRFYKANGDRAAWNVIEKAERDARKAKEAAPAVQA